MSYMSNEIFPCDDFITKMNLSRLGNPCGSRYSNPSTTGIAESISTKSFLLIRLFVAIKTKNCHAIWHVMKVVCQGSNRPQCPS